MFMCLEKFYQKRISDKTFFVVLLSKTINNFKKKAPYCFNTVTLLIAKPIFIDLNLF